VRTWKEMASSTALAMWHLVGVPRDAHKCTPRVLAPARRQQAAERGHKVDAPRGLHLARQLLHLRGPADDAQAVAQPLHGRPAIPMLPSSAYCTGAVGPSLKARVESRPWLEGQRRAPVLSRMKQPVP